MLDELLGQWSQLQSDRCEVWLNKGYRVKDEFNNQWCISLPLEPLGRSLLLSALIGTIEARKLLYRAESTREGTYHITLLDLDSGRYAKGDGDLILAMLKAWVMWLSADRVDRRKETIGREREGAA